MNSDTKELLNVKPNDKDETSSSEDDEDAELLTENVVKDFFSVLSRLKKKDTAVYNKNIKFFSTDKCEQGTQYDSQGDTKKKEKGHKKWLKKQKLKDETEKDGGAHDFWTNPNLSKEDQFLRDYILNQKYLEQDKDFNVAKELAKLEEEEKEVEEALVFEQNYNHRFENQDQVLVKSPNLKFSGMKRKSNGVTETKGKIRKKEQLKLNKNVHIKEPLRKVNNTNENLIKKKTKFNNEFDLNQESRNYNEKFTKNEELKFNEEVDLKKESKTHSEKCIKKGEPLNRNLKKKKTKFNKTLNLNPESRKHNKKFTKKEEPTFSEEVDLKKESRTHSEKSIKKEEPLNGNLKKKKNKFNKTLDLNPESRKHNKQFTKKQEPTFSEKVDLKKISRTRTLSEKSIKKEEPKLNIKVTKKRKHRRQIIKPEKKSEIFSEIRQKVILDKFPKKKKKYVITKLNFMKNLMRKKKKHHSGVREKKHLHSTMKIPQHAAVNKGERNFPRKKRHRLLKREKFIKGGNSGE